MKKSIDDLLDLLQQGIREVLEGEQYCEYLKVMARFPSYSMKNTMLIYQQCPQATMVAGYQTWSRIFGRHVKRGEKGIRILAPYTYKTKDRDDPDGEPVTRTGFRSISVFDISQTEGRALPLPPKAELLEGGCDLFEQARICLEKLTGFSIVCRPLEPDCNGQTFYTRQSIELQEDLDEAHRFKTMLHECAHALMHAFQTQDEQPAGYLGELAAKAELREAEAESVCFVVCSALDIDCSGYSFPYIARWTGQSRLRPQSLERISKTASQMIEALAPLRSDNKERSGATGLAEKEILETGSSAG